MILKNQTATVSIDLNRRAISIWCVLASPRALLLLTRDLDTGMSYLSRGSFPRDSSLSSSDARRVTSRESSSRTPPEPVADREPFAGSPALSPSDLLPHTSS